MNSSKFVDDMGEISEKHIKEAVAYRSIRPSSILKNGSWFKRTGYTASVRRSGKTKCFCFRVYCTAPAAERG